MLTNEQRAHDLAICMLETVKNIRTQEQLRLGNVNAHFDYFEEYKKLYLLNLEAFNQEFPSND